MRHGLIDPDRLAELVSRLGVFGRCLEHLLYAAYHLRAQRAGRPFERALEPRPGLVRCAHHRVGTELHAIESELAPAAGQIERLQWPHGQAVRLALEEKERDAFLSFAASARNHDEVVGREKQDVRYENLHAVQPPPAARWLGGQGDAACVPPARRLRERQCRARRARRDRAESFFFLRLVAGFDQDRHCQPHRGEVRTGEQRAAGFLEHDDQVEERPDAAVLLGNAECRPPKVGDFLPQRRIVTVGALHQPAHDFRAAFLGKELTRRAAQHLLLFRKREIHGEN